MFGQGMSDHLKELRKENERFRKALEQLAAPYSTPPGTGRRCEAWVNAEFQRRMDLAYDALHGSTLAIETREDGIS
jgi:hypothetical protein